MLLGRYKQQPGERLKRIIDLTKWLESTEEIQDVTPSIDVTTTTPLVCNGIVIDPGGKKFAYYVSGGEDATTYMVTFSIETQTQVREDEIEIEVEEI